MKLTFTKNEMQMCTLIARIVHPADYKELFDELSKVSKPKTYLKPEVWKRKMLVKTMELWEATNFKASNMIEDILHDAEIKHKNFN